VAYTGELRCPSSSLLHVAAAQPVAHACFFMVMLLGIYAPLVAVAHNLFTVLILRADT